MKGPAMRLSALSALLALVLLPAFALAQQPATGRPLSDHATKLQELEKSLEAFKTALDTMKAAQADVDAKLSAFLGKPGPTPPGPTPVPPPVPPTPVDPLIAKLKAAFTVDGGTKDQAQKLASIYRAATPFVTKKKADGSFVYDSGIHLIEAIRDLTNDPSWIGAALQTTRDAIKIEVATAFGGPPTDSPLTDLQRAALAALFTKLATILEGF
jgi:hypothetical protein